MDNIEYIKQLTEKIDTLTRFVQGMQAGPKAMLNPNEAATYLGMSKSTLYKHTSAGNIAYYKPNGKLILFRQEDLDNWLYGHRIPANSEL